ncbi:MAG: hypothetical protein KDB22_18195, partial [Planctomycetales bacterium]|nr:hypothetical protein [Planctomycetales bacterium]
SARWQLASLTPGYTLPLLRSWTNAGKKTKQLRSNSGSAIPLGRFDEPNSVPSGNYETLRLRQKATLKAQGEMR